MTQNLQLKIGDRQDILTVSLHSFADLKGVSPLVFLYLLNKCYVSGKCEANNHFEAFKLHVSQVFVKSPVPGPATFAARCLYILPIVFSFSEGLRHLVISICFRLINKASVEDVISAKSIAARIFIHAVLRIFFYDRLVTQKLVKMFEVRMVDVERAISDLKSDSHVLFEIETANAPIEEYVYRIAESGFHEIALDFLQKLAIRHHEESFFLRMVRSNKCNEAEKWANFVGIPLNRVVREFASVNMLKRAYNIITMNNMRSEFPDICYEYKKSLIKKFVDKSLWDLAEQRAGNDPRLIDYLVLLSVEADYFEKTTELCDRYSIDKLWLSKSRNEASFRRSKTLKLDDLNIESIRFINNSIDLYNATLRIEESKVVGLDCEWAPNYVKGSKPNKVSILQVASEKIVLIIDLIKLYACNPEVLDMCMRRIFQSTRILKIGYSFQNDIRQLSQSYGNLSCFQQYKMLLDMQNMFPEGGLSRLSEKILGVGLNKTVRSSNWEQRPLSQSQMEYAAVDAAVLVHIFLRVQSGGLDGHEQVDWKSKVINYPSDEKKAKPQRIR